VAAVIEALAPILLLLVLVPFVPRLRSRIEVVFITALLLMGVAAWATYVQAGGSQNYFLWYPLAAAAVVGAAAVVALAEDGALRARVLRVAGPILAVLIAVAVVNNPHAFGIADPMPRGNRLELFIGSFVGAVTFSGSVIAFGKLAGLGKKFRLFSSAPVVFPGQHPLNLILALVMIGFGTAFFLAEGKAWTAFAAMLAIAFALGVLIIIPIGGADMPVVISMLNSYSGWAAAGIGFSLNNTMLIIAGSLVGSSGAILSYIMCKAMNRSFISVIMGGFGAAEGAVAAGGEQKTVRSGSADDAAFLMANAESVVIVPGYGLAVARAQHAVKEMAQKLIAKGVSVRYAIHPVAGRMPGHMNVLLAEAEVPYEQVFEMEDINGELGTTDVVLVLGANDVVNPLAHEKGSAIYGMFIIEANKARTVLVNKCSMVVGYVGLDNPLFYMDKTMMVFGDAKKVVEDMVKALD